MHLCLDSIIIYINEIALQFSISPLLYKQNGARLYNFGFRNGIWNQGNTGIFFSFSLRNWNNGYLNDGVSKKFMESSI